MKPLRSVPVILTPADREKAEAVLAMIEREIATRRSYLGEPLDDEQVESRVRFERSYWRSLLGLAA